jgi:hypothetical protein
LVSAATHAHTPSVRPTAPIARSRSINISGIKPVATDKWLHYDQVGSVMLATNASAAVADTRHADAFGNEMSSWSAGAWTDSLAERTGWGHNTTGP